MFIGINDAAFFLGIAAPEDKNQVLALLVEGGYHFVCKSLPAFTLM